MLTRKSEGLSISPWGTPDLALAKKKCSCRCLQMQVGCLEKIKCSQNNAFVLLRVCYSEWPVCLACLPPQGEQIFLFEVKIFSLNWHQSYGCAQYPPSNMSITG